MILIMGITKNEMLPYNVVFYEMVLKQEMINLRFLFFDYFDIYFKRHLNFLAF